jgi:post-segregation antitoxin (ccd killing protein)
LLRVDAAEKWRRENADAIKARNERVGRYGLFADRVRKW